MADLTDKQYYDTASNWGSYQYITLEDIVTNFMLMYEGNDGLLNNVNRYKVLFHAQRGIQELNYDSIQEIKALELKVCDDLRYILPPDYVNWVRVSMYRNQVLVPLTENIQANSAASYEQDASCTVLFDARGDVIPETSSIDADRISNTKKSIYLNGGPYNNTLGFCCEGVWYFDSPPTRFGLNTETANINPTFRIDKANGVINFSSGVSGADVLLEYVSDGMTVTSKKGIRVNKLFEEFIYAYIKFSILNSQIGVQEYIVNRARKDKSALLRNAKIRLSNIHPGRLLMNLRGQDKWLK